MEIELENSSSNSDIHVRKRGIINKQRQKIFQYFSPALCFANNDGGSPVNEKHIQILERTESQSIFECKQLCTGVCNGFQFDAISGECIHFKNELKPDDIIRVGQQGGNEEETSREVTCAIILRKGDDSATHEVSNEASEFLLRLSVDLSGPFCDGVSTQEFKDQMLGTIKSVLNSKVVHNFQEGEEPSSLVSLSVIGDFCTSPNEDTANEASSNVDGTVQDASGSNEKFLKLELDVKLHNGGKDSITQWITTILDSELNSHEFLGDLSSHGLNSLSFTNLARIEVSSGMKRKSKSRAKLLSTLTSTSTKTPSTPIRMKKSPITRSPTVSQTDSRMESIYPKSMSWREDAFRLISNLEDLDDGKNSHCLKATSLQVGSRFEIQDCDSISDNLHWFYLDPEDGRLRLNLQPDLCMSWKKKTLFLNSCPRGRDTKDSMFFIESGMIKQMKPVSKSEKGNKVKVVAVTKTSKYGRKIELVRESDDVVDENNKLWTLELARPEPSLLPSIEPSPGPSKCVDEEGWVVGGNLTDSVNQPFAGTSCAQLSNYTDPEPWCKAILNQPNSTYLGKAVDEACCACHGSTFKTNYPSIAPTIQPSISSYP